MNEKKNNKFTEKQTQNGERKQTNSFIDFYFRLFLTYDYDKMNDIVYWFVNDFLQTNFIWPCVALRIGHFFIIYLYSINVHRPFPTIDTYVWVYYTDFITKANSFFVLLNFLTQININFILICFFFLLLLLLSVGSYLFCRRKYSRIIEIYCWLFI